MVVLELKVMSILYVLMHGHIIEYPFLRTSVEYNTQLCDITCQAAALPFLTRTLIPHVPQLVLQSLL